MTGGRALQGVQVGEHHLSVPGRHEAEALTDSCPGCQDSLATPAAVLDQVSHGKITGRVGAYRCRICDAAWLCWWAAP